MDGDRKYKQRGYMDSYTGESKTDRPKPPGPRPPIDVTGPRLPRLVQAVTAARCFNCSATLPADIDFRGTCPKCNAELHCCKQCAHFEPSTRFQCLKPIPVRIAVKDKTNECSLFSPRVTVARDVSSSGAGGNAIPKDRPAPVIETPRSPNDARLAFDRLFKK